MFPLFLSLNLVRSCCSTTTNLVQGYKIRGFCVFASVCLSFTRLGSDLSCSQKCCLLVLSFTVRKLAALLEEENAVLLICFESVCSTLKSLPARMESEKRLPIRKLACRPSGKHPPFFSRDGGEVRFKRKKRKKGMTCWMKCLLSS